LGGTGKRVIEGREERFGDTVSCIIVNLHDGFDLQVKDYIYKFT
jgi:hypothetical protein